MATTYQDVSLSINFAEFDLALECGGGITRCNPGGSYICTGSSARTCPPGSCAGTSIKPQVGIEGSVERDLAAARRGEQDGMDARIQIASGDLENLKSELQKLVSKYAKK